MGSAQRYAETREVHATLKIEPSSQEHDHVAQAVRAWPCPREAVPLRVWASWRQAKSKGAPQGSSGSSALHAPFSVEGRSRDVPLRGPFTPSPRPARSPHDLCQRWPKAEGNPFCTLLCQLTVLAFHPGVCKSHRTHKQGMSMCSCCCTGSFGLVRVGIKVRESKKYFSMLGTATLRLSCQGKKK